MLAQLRHVQAFGIVHAAERICDGKNLGAVLGQGKGGNGAHIAKPLYCCGCLLHLDAERVGGAVDKVGHPAAGSLVTPQRAADGKGLAGHDTGNTVSHVDGIAVHHPRHYLRVGPQVRCHHVDLWANKRDHLLHVPARQALEFAPGHLCRVAGDTAFGPAVGKTGKRTLPTHPHGQGRDFPQSHIRVEPQSSFGRPEREMMLHSVAWENLRGAVVTPNRDGDDHGAFGILQAVALRYGNLEEIGHLIELLAGHPKSRMIVDVHGRNTTRRRTCQLLRSGAQNRMTSPRSCALLTCNPIENAGHKHVRACCYAEHNRWLERPGC